MATKLTVENLEELYPQIKNKLPKDLVDWYEENEFIKMLEFYYDDEEPEDKVFREVIDRELKRMNEILAKADGEKTETKTEKKSAPKADKEPKPKKEPKAKATKPKKEPKPDNSEKVNSIAPEIGFIKRYAALHGKSLNSRHGEAAPKNYRQDALTLLNAIQNAITERRIRKTSPYADEIMTIQKSLIKIVQTKGNAQIDIENVERYREIVGSQSVAPSVAIIKAYIKIQGKENVREKAAALLKRIAKNADTRYADEIEAISRSLDNYTSGRTDAPEMSARSLEGLFGICGDVVRTHSGQAVGSLGFLGSVFHPMDFTGKFRQIIGNPTEPFKIMIYGKPGSGKSTFALEFANYLASEQGKKVLYVAREEGFSYTLQEKLRRLGAAHRNLFIVDQMVKDLAPYDIIFLDSVDALGYEPETLRTLGKGKSFVYIFQTTKNGNFRGSQEFEHDVDTSIVVEDGTATAGKNRFGGSGSVRVG